MKKIILFATTYPYTTGIIAVMWLGSVILLTLDPTIQGSMVLEVNVVLTLVIAVIGFKR